MTLDDGSVRWFGRDRRVGVLLHRDQAQWVLRVGGIEHVLGMAELRSMLRPMRRVRDYFVQRSSTRGESRRGSLDLLLTTANQ